MRHKQQKLSKEKSEIAVKNKRDELLSQSNDIQIDLSTESSINDISDLDMNQSKHMQQNEEEESEDIKELKVKNENVQQNALEGSSVKSISSNHSMLSKGDDKSSITSL